MPRDMETRERDRQTRSLTTYHEKKEIPGWERTGLDPNAVSVPVP